ncbi:MAG: CsgG/HfaB family protein [Rectinemataceae bacterium]
MKRVLIFMALALVSWQAFAEWTNLKDLKVAVLDVVSRVPGESIDTATLTEMLQVALVDRNEFQIVERALLDKIIKEQELQVAGITEGQAAKVGELAGADKVMLVSISKFGDKYIVLVKGIDTKTGIVDLSDEVLSYSVDGFIDLFPVLADRLVRKARGESVGAYRLPAEQAPASATANTPAAAGTPAGVAEGIGGTYRAAGTNPDGTKYEGSCIVGINPDGTYSFVWDIGGASYTGIGKLKDGVMTVDWGDVSPVVYQVQQDGKILVGTWSNGKATETISK